MSGIINPFNRMTRHPQRLLYVSRVRDAQDHPFHLLQANGVSKILQADGLSKILQAEG